MTTLERVQSDCNILTDAAKWAVRNQKKFVKFASDNTFDIRMNTAQMNCVTKVVAVFLQTLSSLILFVPSVAIYSLKNIKDFFWGVDSISRRANKPLIDRDAQGRVDKTQFTANVRPGPEGNPITNVNPS